MAKITNFELYLNFDEEGKDDSEVMFGEIDEDMTIKEIVEQEIHSEK